MFDTLPELAQPLQTIGGGAASDKRGIDRTD
jgi:hypothetical protein